MVNILIKCEGSDENLLGFENMNKCRFAFGRTSCANRQSDFVDMNDGLWVVEGMDMLVSA